MEEKFMLNTTSLIGRLTADLNIRYTPNNKAVATVTLAVSRDRKNPNGERDADFINLVVWGQSAENMSNWVKKGDLVSIIGRIQTRNYENQQGQRIYVTEVVVERFWILESQATRASRGNVPNGNFGSGPNGGYQNQNVDTPTGFMGTSPLDISDDDLPF